MPGLRFDSGLEIWKVSKVRIRPEFNSFGKNISNKSCCTGVKLHSISFNFLKQKNVIAKGIFINRKMGTGKTRFVRIMGVRVRHAQQAFILMFSFSVIIIILLF